MLHHVVLAFVLASTATAVVDHSGREDSPVHIVTAANPDQGKSWVVPNAGHVSNAGGGGLAGNKCASLISGCTVCSPGFKFCTRCDAGYFLDQGKCTACYVAIPHCAVCSSATQCTACKDESAMSGFNWELVGTICAMKIRFDDVPIDARINSFAKIPSGYRGLQWESVDVLKASLDSVYLNTGYTPGTVSQPQVAFNEFGYDAGIRSTGFTFSAISVKTTSAFALSRMALFTGWRNGAQVAQLTVELSKTGPRDIIFGSDFSDIDLLRFGDAPGQSFLLTPQIVLDDLVLR